jgi:hypothetical protein
VFAVRDVYEAANAIVEVRGHYDRHRAAARELAHEFFDAEKLLTRMLDQSGIAPRGSG